MGTFFEVFLAGDDGEHLEAVASAAPEEVARLERLLSRYDPFSEVTRLNREAGRRRHRLLARRAGGVRQRLLRLRVRGGAAGRRGREGRRGPAEALHGARHVLLAVLVSFLDHVRRRDRDTIAGAKLGLLNAATVLLANQAGESGKAVEFPRTLG
jgi:hypothetical protein